VFIEPLYTNGNNYEKMNTEAIRVLDFLASAPAIQPRIAVIQYTRSARLAQELTYDIDDARAALRAPQYGASSCDGDHRGAARLALRVLAEAKSGLPAGQPGRCSMVVYLTAVCKPGDPEADAEYEAFQGAVQTLRAGGGTVIIGCAWGALPSCDHIRRVVSNTYFAWLYSPGMLANVVEANVEKTTEAEEVGGLRLLDGLSGGLSYDPTGASPPPAVAGSGGATSLAWNWLGLDANQPQTVTYRVRPLAEGTWPIISSLAITDDAGASVVVPAKPVTLTVSGLCETPTAPPSPSATASPTQTPTEAPERTPTPTRTATATATPPPWALFLPLALVERCDPEHERADVALVIDTSGSMAGRKLDDAKAAAVSFVDQMDLTPGRDQVTVVRFDAEAEVACELTTGRAVVEAAIRNLTSRSGTHMDKGLRLALAELQSPRHLERNMSVMILLTDGVQTGPPGEELRAAAEVRAAGVRLYSIGLGADVDAATLRQMAGDVSRYHFAPDSSDLARIYAGIASDMACPAPAGGFWPAGG
jgi:Mg-chelatase subunit ChlD